MKYRRFALLLVLFIAFAAVLQETDASADEMEYTQTIRPLEKNGTALYLSQTFIRFLVSTNALNRMAQAKRMVTPCKDTSLDKIYAAFGQLPPDHTINLAELGLADAPDTQVRKAGWLVSNGMMTVDDAVAAFGTIE